MLMRSLQRFQAPVYAHELNLILLPPSVAMRMWVKYVDNKSFCPHVVAIHEGPGSGGHSGGDELVES